jgi:pilus assembly protein Flp/PilA
LRNIPGFCGIAAIPTGCAKETLNINAWLPDSEPRRAEMFAALSRLMRDEAGATAVEYGLIAALIIVICIAAIQIVGTQLNTTFGSIASALTGANAS